MNRKKRLLFCTEFSLLATGFATCGFEIMSRLHKTGKYEIAELSACTDGTDLRIKALPWKAYPVAPHPDNVEARKLFHSKPSYGFGEFRFEETCLDFKPDIVIDMRDPWFFEFEERSPAREYYRWLIQPTVDSMPQNENWINLFQSADRVLTYTDWGLEQLTKQTNGRLNLFHKCPQTGTNLEIYKPKNRVELRKKCGLPPDINIIGTVMRNQPRKLYSDLMQSFRQFIDTAPEQIANNTYLYIHCGYPDVGWDFPKLLKEHGVSHRTFFTYFCCACRNAWPSFFQDAKTICKFCGKNEARLPGIDTGISQSVLSDIYSMFDAYVQYSVCEGLGVPQLEAGACGIPVFAVDYSAMSDVVRKLNGFPIPVERMFRDIATASYRALPDNAKFTKMLIDYFRLPRPARVRHEKSARHGAEMWYNWDRIVETWQEAIDGLEPLDQWNAPSRHFTPTVTTIPEGLSDLDFVNWCFRNIVGRAHLCDSYLAYRIARNLELQLTLESVGDMESEGSGKHSQFGKFSRENVIDIMYRFLEDFNCFETQRVKRIL